jgi:hypothetical protein
MALAVKDIISLGKVVARADRKAATAFSFQGQNLTYSALNETFRDEMKELAKDYYTFQKNKVTIYQIMAEIIEEVFPQKVFEQYGQFAEVKTFAQGTKPIFVQKITQASRRRAKQFIGKVGLAGIYEVFKLDVKSYEVTTNAIGGAAQIGFEEFLDRRIDFADVLDIVMEGMDECIYVEIEKQLFGAIGNVQAANIVSTNVFDETQMDRLLAIADSYGGKADIYCTFEFAATMVPAQGWVSDRMRDEKWNNGYFANYKGHRVIVLPQSFEDETNQVKVIDPRFAYIFASGVEKPVKIAFEGSTIVDEYVGYDRSREVQVYKKVGVRAIFSNDFCVYDNYSLTR